MAIHKKGASGLRHRAEELLKTGSLETAMPVADNDPLRLLHELQVHQVELEMQNSELRQARYELETVLEKYTDLYEFAPVGFFTLNNVGRILAVNLAGASLIGGMRSGMVGRNMVQYISDNDRHIFTEFLQKVLVSAVKFSCEVTLQSIGNRAIVVQIEAMVTASGNEFRLAMLDITERRIMENKLAKQQLELENINNNLELRIISG